MPRFRKTLGVLAALLAAGGGHARVPASPTVPPAGDRAFAGQPYERHHRWRQWRVTVLERPGVRDALTWYQVQVARADDSGETLLYQNTFDAEGLLERTWLEDVRGTGQPVLVVFTRSRGKGAYGSLRLMEIGPKGFRPRKAPTTPKALLQGFRGQDLWRWEGDSLWREFQVYRNEDEDFLPTGGRRILRFTWEKNQWRVRYKHEGDPRAASTPDRGAVDPSPVP